MVVDMDISNISMITLITRMTRVITVLCSVWSLGLCVCVRLMTRVITA